MNAFEYSNLLPPLGLGVANVLFAGLLHRTILHNPALLRRRHFYEFLAVLAFVVALVLLATGLALWRGNPVFVLVCSASWILFCTITAAVVRYQERREAKDELALPDLWPTMSNSPIDALSGAPTPRRVVSPGATVPNFGRTAPVDALTRARLKRAMRDRSVGGGQVERRIRPAHVLKNQRVRVRPEHETS